MKNVIDQHKTNKLDHYKINWELSKIICVLRKGEEWNTKFLHYNA